MPVIAGRGRVARATNAPSSALGDRPCGGSLKRIKEEVKLLLYNALLTLPARFRYVVDVVVLTATGINYASER
jgi:hypothetical protein